jgi:hypothetical protein
MLRPAKRGKGSKSKRKGQKNRGNPVQTWRKCNDDSHTRRGLKGEYADNEPREYANGTQQHRGHVKLVVKETIVRKEWPENYSEDFLAVRATTMQIAKRAEAQAKHGARCHVHHIVLPIAGTCDQCE